MEKKQRKELQEKLTTVRRWLGIGDATETFDDIADWFYADTGIMRPGKDAPQAMRGHSDEERLGSFGKWAQEKRAVVLSAIAQSIDMVQETEGDRATGQPCICQLACAGYDNSDQCACGCMAICHQVSP